MSESEPASEPDLVHRLKNHLCIIVGFCDLLLVGFPDDDPRRADLLEIYRAARDALAVMPEVDRRLRW